jgi:hypothetical protein
MTDTQVSFYELGKIKLGFLRQGFGKRVVQLVFRVEFSIGSAGPHVSQVEPVIEKRVDEAPGPGIIQQTLYLLALNVSVMNFASPGEFEKLLIGR